MRRLMALLALLSNAACATYTITEDKVFTPITAYQGAQSDEEIDLSLMWEDAFRGDTPILIEIEAWFDQKASIEFEANELTPANVTHGFIDTDENAIAYTLIERESEGQRPLIVHCGGNTAAREDSGTPYGLKLIEFGDAFLFDYPGYGDSPGEASVETLQAMARAVVDYVDEKASDGRQVILWGHSLGGFVCADMAPAFARVDAVVLETSARNAAEVADSASPWFIKPFVKVSIEEAVSRFDNVSALDGVDVPILVLGARRDKTLAVWLSRKLAGDLLDAGHNVTYQEFAGANHISVATDAMFRPVVEAFLMPVARSHAALAGG